MNYITKEPTFAIIDREAKNKIVRPNRHLQYIIAELLMLSPPFSVALSCNGVKYYIRL